jgi:Raf kinase inhibitor-like YbhB/YbcL family protein
MAFTLHSSDFADGAEIPKAFTCDDADQSPALAWSQVPEGTKSFALVADDPDAPAGTWVHWVQHTRKHSVAR